MPEAGGSMLLVKASPSCCLAAPPTAGPAPVQPASCWMVVLEAQAGDCVLQELLPSRASMVW
jgi:hypothetical protein